MRPISFGSSSVQQARPAVRFGNEQQQKAQERVNKFLSELDPQISDQALRSKITFSLIGPTFMAITDHPEYSAMKNVAESNRTPAETKTLAQRCMNILDNYYDLGDPDDFGTVGGGFIE